MAFRLATTSGLSQRARDVSLQQLGKGSYPMLQSEPNQQVKIAASKRNSLEQFDTRKQFDIKLGEQDVFLENICQILAKQLRQPANTITAAQIVEVVLANDDSVRDCAVLVKDIPEFDSLAHPLIAYVVPGNPFNLESLKHRVQTQLPVAFHPFAYIPIATLPLTQDGEVDYAALDRLPLLDVELQQQWETAISTIPAVDRVAVVEQEFGEPAAVFHLSDLISGWKPFSATSALNSGAIAPTHVGSVESPPSGTNQTSVPIDRLAMSAGDPLQLGENAPQTFAAALQRAAQAIARGILYVQEEGGEQFQSYATLLTEAERVLAGLRQLGLKPQDKVIFQLDQNQDFLAAFWGCVLGGFVPVPISIAPTYQEVNNTVSKLHHAWQLLDQPLILCSRALEPAISALSQLLPFESLRVASIDQLRQSAPDSDWHPSQPDDLAILLLTSGSTGMPKGVMQTHRTILAQAAGSAQTNGFSNEDISLNWMPLDHVGGIVMCHIRDVYLANQQIQVPTNFILKEPLRWLDLIDRYRATYTWAPNFAYGLINDRASELSQRQWDLSCMRFMLNGGEAIVAKTARRFLELMQPFGLPATAMHPAWGMSETCSGVTHSDRFQLATTHDEDAFVEVGAPIPGFLIRIVNHEDQVVQEGEIGRLQVSGSTVTPGYYQNCEANKTSFTADGWFNTGDLGYLRQGRLTITGREKDIIIINGVNYYSHEIEAVVEEVDQIEVSYTAACAVRVQDTVDRLAIFFYTSITDRAQLVEQLQEIRRTVVRKIGVNPDYLLPVVPELIPKTSIGKIQRTQLKQQFEAGEFDAILKQVDLLLRNANTLPDWFYRKVWCPKTVLRPALPTQTGQSLIFLDQQGLGTTLQAALHQPDRPCITVEQGTTFAKITDFHYCINPADATHYDRLLRDLALERMPLTQICHLYTYGRCLASNANEENSDQLLGQGTYSLLYLLQALVKVQRHTAVKLLVVSSQVQAVVDEDAIHPTDATLLGVIKSAPQEIPGLSCCHLDLPLQPQLHESYGMSLLQELQGISIDREIAYRHGQRFVAGLEKISLPAEHLQPLPWKAGELYVVSGGLGGIGLELARYLLQHYQVKLLLLGRSPLPPRAQWETELKQDTPIAQKLKTYLELESLPGKLYYEAIDLGDTGTATTQRLQQVVGDIESQQHCTLAGVIHLAGVYHEQMLVQETRQSFEAILQPKVKGTWVLHHLVQDRPGSLFVHFSSLTSFFGGAMVGAYAAANQFLESFAHYQRQACGMQSYCLSWSVWHNTGMSQNSQAGKALAAKGYQTILPEQGFASLLTGLSCHTTPHLLIGLDGNNREVRRYTHAEPYALQQLCAFYSVKAGCSPLLADAIAFNLPDRFHIPSSCRLQWMAALPITATGEVDRAKLTTLAQASVELTAPTTAIERQIVLIWQKLLNASAIGIDDNFFEQGGNSLLGVQLLAELEKAFQVELPPVILFEAPTVSGLATRIEQLVRSAAPIASAVEVSQPSRDSAPTSVVLVKPGGNRIPFFFVPGGGAIDVDFLMYAQIFRALHPTQPVYCLAARQFDAVGKRYMRLETMAADYIQEIRLVQPHGPYLLGGECGGGILSFEIARQLVQAGEEVALLALLDTGVPLWDTYFRYRIRTGWKQFNRRLNYQVQHVSQLGWMGYSKRLFHRLIPTQLKQKRSRRSPHRVTLELEQQLALQNHSHYNPQENEYRAKLLFCYQPQPYQGRITLLINEARHQERYSEKAGPEWTNHRYPNDSSLGWASLAQEGVEIHVVPGNHDTYIRDYAEVTAQILGACLEKAQNRFH